MGCIGLTNVEIPNSVISIGNGAFSGCTGLKSIEIPNSVISIGGSAFGACTGLTSVEIGNSVTSIGNSAFSECSGLTSVVIPNSVTSIGNGAFESCTGLISVEIGKSVSSIGDSCFRDCSQLKTFKIADGEDPVSFGYYVLENCAIEHLYLGRSWTYAIDREPLYIDFTSVVIGPFVSHLPEYAFRNCKNLKTIHIPSSVKSIGSYAFDGCSNLESVEIGCGIEYVGENAFGNSVADVYVTALEPAEASDNSFSNYKSNLWLTPGARCEYMSSINCWWQFNNRKELIVPEEFTVARSEITGDDGKQFRAAAIFTPDDVTLPYVFWHSSDPLAATIDSNGLITIIDSTRGCDITAFNLYAENNIAVIKVNGGQQGVKDVYDNNAINGEYPNDIYNLQGVCLKHNALQEDIDALAPGFYIIAGKKVLVR